MKRFTLLALVLLVVSIPAFARDNGGSSSNYREFTTLEDSKALAAKGPTVLFFYASWCPSCRATEKDIMGNLDKLGDIVVLKIDYDTSAKLQKKYGVTYQDTFVQINKKGGKINLWNGGGIKKLIMSVRS